MEDNIHLYVRPPKCAGEFYTIEDADKNVLAWGRTLEAIAVKWRQITVRKPSLKGCSVKLQGAAIGFWHSSQRNGLYPLIPIRGIQLGKQFGMRRKILLSHPFTHPKPHPHSQPHSSARPSEALVTALCSRPFPAPIKPPALG
jgi:hypothetical protein